MVLSLTDETGVSEMPWGMLGDGGEDGGGGEIVTGCAGGRDGGWYAS
jgi:hypothetical protein